jgi:acyl carrier protein
MSDPALPTEADVRALLRTILGVPPEQDAELRRADLDAWDSLKHMEIVFALEDRYGVRFHESEFALLTTSAAIMTALRKRLAA